METAEQGTSGGFCSPFRSRYLFEVYAVCVRAVRVSLLGATVHASLTLTHTHAHICSLAQGDERHFSRFSVERRYTY